MAKINNRTVMSDRTGAYTVLPAAVAAQPSQGSKVYDNYNLIKASNAGNTPTTVAGSTYVPPRHTWDAATSLEAAGLPMGNAPIEDTTPADKNLGGKSGGGGGGGTYQQSVAPVADPYADLYAIYQQKLDAQNAANEQRRAARLGALQSNYANAKSKLSDAFNSGETALNTDAERALREAYVQAKLNERALNQQLQSMGINGGAAESSLAKAYNDYGNSRNAIEQNRMDALKELLSQYQGQLGDMESAYSANLADLDSDYFGNGLDFITNYYDTIANLQAQNAASNLKSALGKSGGAKITTDDGGLDTKSIVSTLSKYKGNLADAEAYLDYVGVPEEQRAELYWAAGINPDSVPTGAHKARLDSIDNDVLSRFMSYVDGNRGQIYNGDAQLLAAVQRFGKQYGLTEAQMRALLTEASKRY